MVSVDRVIGVPPSRVFAQLSDGWTYAGWVVGSAHVRAVDDDFPAVGTRLHHSVGGWPVLVQDYTEVIGCEPDQRLTLRVRAWPAGEGNVDIALYEQPGGSTRVVLTEAPVAGPGQWLYGPPLRWILRRRNIESLGRLAVLCERRADPATDPPH